MIRISPEPIGVSPGYWKNSARISALWDFSKMGLAKYSISVRKSVCDNGKKKRNRNLELWFRDLPSIRGCTKKNCNTGMCMFRDFLDNSR